MSRNMFSIVTFSFLLTIIVIPVFGVAQDYCDGNNLMSATQQIFFCPMMGNRSTTPAATFGPFPNTKWRVTSIIPKPEKAFKSISFSFQSDGTVVETTEEVDGKVVTSTQKYRVQGTTMLLSKPGVNTNVRFGIDGDTMTVDTGLYSVVLEKIN